MTRPPHRAPLGARPAEGGAARGAAAGPLLRVEDVHRAFGGLIAVDGASFAIRRGTISGLIGPNGAGKTTLFNLISGFLPPDRGRVVFDGEDITGRRPHRVFLAGLCRTFQIPREFKELTVLENLMVVPPNQLGERLWAPWIRARAIRAEEAEIRDKALGVLDLLKLGALAAAPARTLSGGQKKLLELARALMGDPVMLLLDEPGAGVNPTLMKELSRAIEAAPPIKAGDKVNYEGASGTCDFDEAGDIFTDFGLYRITLRRPRPRARGARLLRPGGARRGVGLRPLPDPGAGPARPHAARGA